MSQRAARSRRWLRLGLVGLWLTLLAGALVWARQQGLGIRESVEIVYDYVLDNPLAPIVYILIYALRSLTFFPAMWLTIAAGSLFGFVPGLIFALIGENASAQTAYLLARFFHLKPQGDDNGEVPSGIKNFRRLLLAQSFPTVLVLRASYLPFDLVNYSCGLLRVPWLAYTAGSLIGMLPPMVTFVSFGATVSLPRILTLDHFSPGQLIDARQLTISAGLVGVSIIIAYIAHRRRKALAARS